MTAGQVASAPAGFLPGAADTIPRLLVERADATPDRDALRHKELGIWHTVSWSALALRVEAVAAALHEMGVGAGGVVAILSDNRPEWLITELAAQSLGAAVVGPHPESHADELLGVLRATGATVLLVEDQRQLDKVGSADPRPDDVAVVCVDMRGVGVADATSVRSFAALEDSGRAAVRPDWWRGRVAAGNASEVAVLCLPARAGATPAQLAAPAPVGLTHAGLLASSTSLSLGEVPPVGLRYVSVLPLGWSWEQVAGVCSWLRGGFPISFPEGPLTQRSDLREIGPDVLLAPARAWEAMAAELQAAAADAGRMRGGALRWAQTRIGVSRRLADALVLRTVRDRVGLTRLERAWSFGAPLREDVQSFFTSIGVDLRQLYGADAAGGPVAAQTGDGTVPGAVGTALPGVELELGPDGEVLVRSAAVPADRVGPDGWLHTGDVARVVDGQLVVLDRAEDVLVVDGEHVSPSRLEAMLRSSRYVEDAVVLLPPGGPVSALVVLDARAVGEWAERQRLHASSYEALTQLPAVGDLVRAELAQLGGDAPTGAAVRRCVVLRRRLDPERGEVSRTLVVRRRIVLSSFPAEVAALGAASVPEVAGPVRVLDIPGSAA